MLDMIDIEAITESDAIHRHKDFTNRPSGRDDNKIRSKNHFLRNEQPICKESRNRRQKRNSRQLNLQHIRIMERLENPELYKQFS